jgi:CHASE1-domain containing sensor protein
MFPGHPKPGCGLVPSPLHLVQEPTDKLGFIVYDPVYSSPATTPEARRSSLVGFVLMTVAVEFSL